MHERRRWGHSGEGRGRRRCRRPRGRGRGRGNVVPGPLSRPAPAARRVIASLGQASRVRPLLHTAPPAPTPLPSRPGARSGPFVRSLYSFSAARAPSTLITTRFLCPRCTPPPAQSASRRLLRPLGTFINVLCMLPSMHECRPLGPVLVLDTCSLGAIVKRKGLWNSVFLVQWFVDGSICSPEPECIKRQLTNFRRKQIKGMKIL